MFDRQAEMKTRQLATKNLPLGDKLKLVDEEMKRLLQQLELERS